MRGNFRSRAGVLSVKLKAEKVKSIAEKMFFNLRFQNVGGKKHKLDSKSN